MKGTHMVQNSEDILYFIAYLVRLNEEHDLNFPLQPLEWGCVLFGMVSANVGGEENVLFFYFGGIKSVFRESFNDEI